MVRQGEPGATLYVVAAGRLKVETQPGSADAVVLDILGAGDIFGELFFFTRRTPAANVVALEPCELVAIDYRDLRGLIERRPTVAMALLENLANRIILFGDSMRSFAVADLEARLSRRLCVLAETQGRKSEGAVILDLNLRQRDWARMSGVSREAVNRQFRTWSERGWVDLAGGEIRIRDLEALRDLADLAGLFTD